MNLAPRAEMPWYSNFNGLRCQTVLIAAIEDKRLFGALSNGASAYFAPTITTITNTEPAMRIATRHEKIGYWGGADIPRGCSKCSY
jgi:hypothetical protein